MAGPWPAPSADCGGWICGCWPLPGGRVLFLPARVVGGEAGAPARRAEEDDRSGAAPPKAG